MIVYILSFKMMYYELIMINFTIYNEYTKFHYIEISFKISYIYIHIFISVIFNNISNIMKFCIFIIYRKLNHY